MPPPRGAQADRGAPAATPATTPAAALNDPTIVAIFDANTWDIETGAHQQRLASR